MMKNKLVITTYREHQCMALFEDNIPCELFFQEESSQVGNIYVGKVKNIVKNINAAFVELAHGCMAYFSMKDETPIYLNQKSGSKMVVGDEILVQLVKDGIKTKAPQVSSKLNLTGKYIVLSLEAGSVGISNKIKDSNRKKELKRLLTKEGLEQFGVIIRTNALEADDLEILSEFTMLKDEMKQILEIAKYRKPGQCLYHVPNGFVSMIQKYANEQLEVIVTDISETYEQLKTYFELYDESLLQKLSLYQDDSISLASAYNLTKEIDHALNKRVWLKSGGYLVIEQTEAMVVIDVNTGKAIGKQDMDKHIFKINTEAAKMAAAQIRLRNLSGIIIIDFINMKNQEDKNLLIQILKEELKKDSVQANYVDTTALGLVEITRKKIRKSLLEHFE